MKMRLKPALALFLAALAAPLEAQELEPLAVRQTPRVVMAALPQEQPARNELGVRVGLGIAGGFVGLLAGGVIGYGMPDGQCGDDPGLCEIVAGMAIGTALGAGLGAAIPRRGARCDFFGRAALGVVGAIALGAAGVALGFHSPAVLVTVPVFAGLGAGIGATAC